MHFRLPKPLHGWREFAGEVGIIVIGVLIALGAEQLIEDLHWRNEVAGLRNVLKDELSYDLGTYPYRAKQEACISARLNELQEWLNSWRSGHPLQIKGIIGIPVSRTVHKSVWDGADPNTLAHFPRSERVFYGYLYDEFANNDIHRLDERATWIELNSFDDATQLDHQDQIRLQGLVYRARLRDRRIAENYRDFSKRAAAMALQPKADPTWPPMEPSLCRPILQPSTAS